MGVLQEDMAGDIGAVPTCRTCGSERVVKDAWVCWNPETGLWEVENVFDQAFCQQCEQTTTLVWKRKDGCDRTAVRELNDRFRTEGRGNGSFMLTVGVQSLGEAFVRKAVTAVQGFDDFSKDNDPWGEHDFGSIEIDGEKVFWKIDCYDLTMTAGSPNPANEAVTHRVLTIMLANEY